MQFMVRTKLPCFLKVSAHASFAFGSERSLLLRMIRRLLLLTSSSMIGFLLETGIRASITSITISTIFRFSAISSLVFFICPGYQLICSIMLFSPLHGSKIKKGNRKDSPPKLFFRFNFCSLTCSFTHVVQFRSSYRASSYDFDLFDLR